MEKEVGNHLVFPLRGRNGPRRPNTHPGPVRSLSSLFCDPRRVYREVGVVFGPRVDGSSVPTH